MPNRIQTLAALSRETGQRIVSSPEEWQAFLRAAARLYKYPFEEQLLIYAQRPDATACAKIEQWNKSIYRRWVKPGAKGIALIDTTGAYPRLKYVFDAADTRETPYSRPLQLWQFRAEYAEQVSEELQNHFGETDAAPDFKTQLRAIISNATEDNIQEYAAALSEQTENSHLADTDAITLQALLHIAVSVSVEYVTLSRLGMSTDHITEDDWLAISLFNTLETAAQLGAAVSDISEMVLRQIERSVKTLEKERGTFANPAPVLDNELEKEIERSARYGTDLQAGGQLPHPRPDVGRAAEGAAGQVRDAAQEVFEGTQERDLRGAGAQRNAASAPFGDRPDRADAGGADHAPDGGGRGRDGSHESSRPNGLGEQDEQHQEPGRGNGTERLDIQLTEERLEKAESKKLPAFLSESLIFGALKKAFYTKGHAPADIAAFYRQNADYDARSHYMSEAFDDAYTELLVDGVRVGYKRQENGLLMWEGSYLSRTSESLFNWSVINEFTGHLLEQGELVQTEQVTLFDSEIAGGEPALPTIQVQIGNIREAQSGQLSLLSVSQQSIDEVLCSAGNEENGNLRICAYVQAGHTDEELAAFLREEYNTGGLGIRTAEGQIAAWWDENGVRIAQGKRARYENNRLLSWEEVARRTRELLELGRYMSADDLQRVNENERKEVAEQLWYLDRDIEGGHLLEETVFKRGFPEDTVRIAQELADAEQREAYLAALSSLAERYAQDRNALRYHNHKIGRLMERLAALDSEPIDFQANAPIVHTDADYFITEDEIDRMLTGGSGVQHGKYRIYLYFIEQHTAAEKAAFLRKEYGIGGFGRKGYDESHDGKGVTFSRGRAMKPYEKLTLTWPQVTRRIDALITQGRYLNETQLAHLPTYQQEQAERQAKHAAERALRDAEQAQREAAQEELRQAAAQMENRRKTGEYHFTLGDDIRLNGQTHTLLSLAGNMAELTDPKFPLLTVTYPRAEFESMVRADPANDHLLVQENEPIQDAGELTDEHEETGNAHATGYDIGDTVYLEGGKPYLISDISETEVRLSDPEHQPPRLPLHRSEPIANFERLLLRDARNRPFTDYLASDLDEVNADLRDALVFGLLDEQSMSRIGQWFWEGAGNHSIAEQLSEACAGEAESIELTTGETADYFADANGFTVELQDKFNSRLSASWQQIARILRALYMRGMDGISLPPQEQTPLAEQPPVTANAQPQTTTETIAIYPAEENNLPYDIVIERMHIGEPERTPAQAQPKPPNYRITDDNLGHGGQKAKYQMNIAAIRTLQAIEAEGRFATSDEQEILSRYVGWGGVADVFDPSKENWADEYAELKSLLTEQEYEAARASTLNAHYTSPTVIRAIYEAIGNMGFTTGNILEPSCGVGNFFGMLPEGMMDSKLYGVELDPITGRIAKQLYPHADIQIKGFEETQHPDSFFDIAVGNVPFGNYSIPDKRYDKQHPLIHDYFFMKTLDKVRPGGVVAFITSKGTMDKKDPSVRRYLAERAELLGAVRLPNNAFQANAGTEVTTDILFLQKRERPAISEPDWVQLGESAEGFAINQYFVDNPHMVLGELTEERTQYGKMEYTVAPIPGADLSEQLREVVSHIQGSYQEPERDFDEPAEENEFIPADPNIPNYSFGVSNGKLYYRIDSQMRPADASQTAQGRIRGLIGLRECTRRLIEYQLENSPDEIISREQARLNALYDRYVTQYGRITSRGNSMAFSDDTAYPLLCSLEELDENGAFKAKADMFTKRTIRAQQTVTHVDTAEEALAVSIGERARVDLAFMSELSGMSEDELVTKLRGVIFLNIGSADAQDKTYVTADEYLSGNVREKLALAKAAQTADPDGPYAVNVEALTAAQPTDLQAGDIEVRLGSTWIPPEVVGQFMYQLLNTPSYRKHKIKVLFSSHTAIWNVTGKSEDYDNTAANLTYGTKRISAYKIIEETLNLRDVRIFDNAIDANGNEIRVLNKKETVIAQQKQQAIREAFRDWIWKEPERREGLVRLYNDKFNAIRPREYDGSHIQFHGMNPEIELRPHQKNAVARILYGGNTLLGHVVGSGKTYTMAAAAMEAKRLGLCHKPMFVVPNHLTEQWASEFLQLYPAANILVTSKKEFERHRRQRFCSRIATGDYDAVIIGHSQFEKIPVSIERQRAHIQEQIDEVLDGIHEAKEKNAERFTIKQMERVRKSLEAKLKKLNDTAKKDSVITFEELGVDRLFVDEAHGFKNLAAFTKMRNVAGISQTEAQKSSDMFMKTRYLDGLTGNRGVVFATGTPISNTMVEMYTMQRYLQYDELARQGLSHFDAWASTFGETITAMELAPEGTGFRLKTRFARFFNLPELTAMFREVADIQTADMLNLPVPEADYHTEVLKPSEFQREMLKELAQRADEVRKGNVEPHIDNMLRITNDGRKLALDQRLLNPLLPDEESGKSAACAEKVFHIWQEGGGKRLAQLVFCDNSTPKTDAFDVYNDVKNKLVEKGIPENEIAFIHDANSDAQKAALFSQVRAGQVRVLLGSTAKMGAGTNVQKLLIGEHHLDCPWRPADIEQREGRIIRQGNENPKVQIYRYVTENTFDAYMWATIEAKQRFISQIMTSKSPARSCEDIDEQALSYAEVKALAAGDPRIKERMDLEVEVSRLKLLKASHANQQYELQNRLLRYPLEMKQYEAAREAYEADAALYARNKGDGFPGMTVCEQHFAEKKDAGAAIISACKAKTDPAPSEIGEYMGFKLLLTYADQQFKVILRGAGSYTVALGDDIFGNIQRLDNQLAGLEKDALRVQEVMREAEAQWEAAKKDAEQPFPQEATLQEKSSRLAALDADLRLGGHEDNVLDAEPEIVERPQRELMAMAR